MSPKVILNECAKVLDYLIIPCFLLILGASITPFSWYPLRPFIGDFFNHWPLPNVGVGYALPMNAW